MEKVVLVTIKFNCSEFGGIMLFEQRLLKQDKFQKLIKWKNKNEETSVEFEFSDPPREYFDSVNVKDIQITGINSLHIIKSWKKLKKDGVLIASNHKIYPILKQYMNKT